MPRTKHCDQKRYNSTPTSVMSIDTDDSIEPTTDRHNPDSEGVISDTPLNVPGELFNLASEDLIKSVKARQDEALVQLQSEMNHLTTTFTDRAVSIVEEGFRNCFLQASQRIRRIQLTDWTTTDGNELGETINTIALPSSTTDGDDA